MSSGLPDYTDNVSVYGAVTISGTVTISGDVYVTNTVTVTGAVTVTGSVTVSGTVSISGSVTVTGTVAISGTVTVSGAVTVSGTVAISGTVTVSGTVAISGTVTVSGSVTVSGAVTITSGTVSISGTVTISGAVTVTSGNITVSGTVSISGTVTVSGTVSISGTVTISGTVSVSGTVTISGAVTITSGTVSVSGTVTISGAVTVTSGNITVSGTVSISGTVTVSGAVTVSGTVAISGTVTISGTVSISGSVTITGSVSITNATLNVTIGNTVIATGQTGPAVGLNGTTSYLTRATALITPDGSDFCIVLKVKGTNRCWATANSAYQHYGGENHATTILGFYTDNNDGTNDTLNAAYPAGFDDTVFNIVAWEVEKSGADYIKRIYANGTLAGSKTVSSKTIRAWTSPFNVGRLIVEAQYLEGAVGAVMVFNRALTTTEHTTLGGGAINAPPVKGLILWWKLGEGTGTTAADSSGNNYTGTLTSCVWLSSIGSVPSAIAVNIQASQITMNITITAQSVDLTVLAPTGKMVSSGETVLSSSLVVSPIGCPANNEISLVAGSGRGKITFIAVHVYGDNATDDMEKTYLRVYIDGAKKFDMKMSEIDEYLNGYNVGALSLAVSTWYQATYKGLKGCVNRAQTCSDSVLNWQNVRAELISNFEYTTSYEVKLYNQSYGWNMTGAVLFGAYV